MRAFPGRKNSQRKCDSIILRNKTVFKNLTPNFVTDYKSAENNREDLRTEEKMDESERIHELICPLCQEGFKDKDTLEQHAMQLHSINAEGLQRLMMLMQGSHWLNAVKNAGKEDEEKDGGKF